MRCCHMPWEGLVRILTQSALGNTPAKFMPANFTFSFLWGFDLPESKSNSPTYFNNGIEFRSHIFE